MEIKEAIEKLALVWKNDPENKIIYEQAVEVLKKYGKVVDNNKDKESENGTTKMEIH